MAQFEVSVLTSDGKAAVTSLQLAENFGIRHHHVLRDIKAILRKVPESFAATNFGFSEYPDSTGRMLPSYHLTRDAFTLLAMGYNSPRAITWKIKYIEAFNQLEALALEKVRAKALAEGMSLRHRMTPKHRAAMKRALRYQSMGLGTREIGKLMDCSHQKVFYLLKDAKLAGLEV